MNHINAIMDGGRGARAHLCALTTAMEDAAWKHFQVEIEQFNKKRLMNHINLYVPKKGFFRNTIIRSRKWLYAISTAIATQTGTTDSCKFWKK